jgi:acetyltransferase-like isoleucine patch superfamily enzyme
MSRLLRQAWYLGARLLDEAHAGFDSIALGALLKATTGRWPRQVRADGLPRIRLHPSATLDIGTGVRLISRYGLNAVGGQQRVILWVGPSGYLSIGDRSGMSHTTIVCLKRIDIGRGVMIGGGATIVDSDFHALPLGPETFGKAPVTLPVTIEDDVFIGARTTILKGVTIGRGAVVGAASVVTASIPPYEVWAGNPARRIGSALKARRVAG